MGVPGEGAGVSNTWRRQCSLCISESKNTTLRGSKKRKTSKGGLGQIKNAFEFADLANKSIGYPVQFEFSPKQRKFLAWYDPSKIIV